MKSSDSAREAIKLLDSDRHADYGDTSESFNRIADIFYLLSGKRIEPEDIALLMMALKLSRDRNVHKDDNLIDLIGYASIRNYLINIKNNENK